MSAVRKVQLISLGLAAIAGLAAAVPVAADSYSVDSSTFVSGSTSGVCASTTLQAQQNGAYLFNQTVTQCVP